MALSGVTDRSARPVASGPCGNDRQRFASLHAHGQLSARRFAAARHVPRLPTQALEMSAASEVSRTAEARVWPSIGSRRLEP